MRKIICLLLVIVAPLLTTYSKAAAQIQSDFSKIKLGEIVKIPELPKDKVFYALEKEQVDLNGDGGKEEIVLVGEKDDPKSLLTKNVYLIVIDQKNAKLHVFPFRKEASYSPKLYFGDMNGDGIPEILNEFPNPSGNENSYFIGSFKDNKVTMLYSEKEIEEFFSYSGKLKDAYIFQLTNKQLKITVPVTVYGYRELYIEDGIYNKKGKLLKQIDSLQFILGKMYFDDSDNDGKDELYGQSIVTGISEGNIVAHIITKLVMKDGKLIPVHIDVCGTMEDIAQ